MRSLLDQLESTEAILLMYLADELNAQDRAEVERRLASDASWQTELEKLRAAHETVAVSLSALDDLQPIASSKLAAAERALARVIRQWHADRVLAYASGATPQARRSKWWIVYASGAAAAMIVGFIVWWGIQPAELRSPLVIPTPYPEYSPIPTSFATDYTNMSTLTTEAEDELETLASLRSLTQPVMQ